MNPLDLYDIAGSLSEEERMVQGATARLVDERVLPVIQKHFEDHTFPRDLVPEIAALGLLGSSIEGYGCAGMNAVSYGLICQELERGDSGIRSFVSVQSSLCMYPIHAFGSEAQREKYLPRMATGELIGCFGLTEPHGGSDPVNMKTHAKRRGKDWVLNGAKMWITNAPIADLAVVWAKTEEGIRGFIVEKGTRGFAAPEIERKFSLRASATGALYLEDVVVPEENMLPGSTIGLKAPLSCLTQARFGITWGVIGAAQACLAQLLDYTQTRVLFGRPLAANQAIQIRLAAMARGITGAQLMSLQLGRLKDAGKHAPVAGLARQVEQLPHGARRRARRARHAGRLRHQRRVRADPARAQPRERDHLRGHRDDPPAHDRPRTHGNQRVLTTRSRGVQPARPRLAPSSPREGHRETLSRLRRHRGCARRWPRAAAAVMADPPSHAPGARLAQEERPYYVGYTGRQWYDDYGVRGGRCDRDRVGAALGAVVGGAIGAAVSDDDDRLIAILAGATIGAVIGHEIGDEMDDDDRACFGHSLELLEDGHKVVWDGSKRGMQYTLTPDRPLRARRPSLPPLHAAAGSRRPPA